MEASRAEIDFLELLCSLKKDTEAVEPKGSHNLLKYLKKMSGLNTARIDQLLVKFEGLGLLTITKLDLSPYRLKLNPEKIETFLNGKRIKRTVAIFLDYVNLEQTIEDKNERFSKMRDLSWLLSPILEKKWRIIYAYIFIPDHYATRIPLMTLTRKFGFKVFLCPRQVEGVTTKDADTVDTQLKEVAWSVIEHSDITDIIIVSGDADFQSLTVFATNQGKNVTLVSTAQAISGRFLDMESDGLIKVKLLT